MRQLPKLEELLEQLFTGDQLAAARLITLVENYPEKAQDVLRQVYLRSGKADIIGVTGPGGAGKSSLINQLIFKYRAQRKTIGVVAVDPSSPISGGSFLGDRVRLNDHYRDPGVFIRSMASRGHIGGLARATCNVIRILEALGMDIIIVETLGVGQDEVEVHQLADTCLLVVTPGMGDEIQTFKAGVFEIADIIVLNKADQQGAQTVRLHLESLLDLTCMEETKWMPHLVSSVSVAGSSDEVSGIDELVSIIEEHLDYIRNKNHTNGATRNVKRLTYELEVILKSKLEEMVLPNLLKTILDDDYFNKILNADIDPYAATDEVMEKGLPFSFNRI